MKGVGNDSDFGAGITDERAGTGSWLIIDILELVRFWFPLRKSIVPFPKIRNSNGEKEFSSVF